MRWITNLKFFFFLIIGKTEVTLLSVISTINIIFIINIVRITVLIALIVFIVSNIIFFTVVFIVINFFTSFRAYNCLFFCQLLWGVLIA